MERTNNMKKILILLILNTMLALNMTAQNHTQMQYYRPFLTGDMKSWLGELTKAEIGITSKSTVADRLSVITARYGYIGYCLGTKKTLEAEKHVKKMESELDYVLKVSPKNADATALKGALYGFFIALSPYKAVYLGPQSMSYVEEAIKLDKNSPVVNLERGNIEFFTPSTFGGSKKLALQYFESAMKGFENKKMQESNWQYLNTLAQIARCYTSLKDIPNAKLTYEKILKIAPDFKWIRDEEFPAFKKKHGV